MEQKRKSIMLDETTRVMTGGQGFLLITPNEYPAHISCHAERR